MIRIRKSEERGSADRGWIRGRFTFSFADYQDPAFQGFRALRVINEDLISAGKGFGPHAHRDMEILSYVLEGSLRHRDSTGQEHLIGPNEIQVMSAGDGIVHSEFNGSETEPTHMLQIWIEPNAEDLRPSYQQIAFSAAEKRGRLRLLAGPEPPPGVALIRQDARVYVTALEPGESVSHILGPNRYGWVQVTRGSATLNGEPLGPGDGAAVSQESELRIATRGAHVAEVLVFDLA